MPSAETASGHGRPGAAPGEQRASLLWISGAPGRSRPVEGACAAVGLSPVVLGRGEDPLARFSELLPEIVLVDCEPDLAAALAVCGRLQRHRGSDYRPVVAVVPEKAHESVVSAITSCFDDVVTRPLERSALETRLTLLRRNVAAREQLRLAADAIAATPVAMAVVDARRETLALALCNPAFESLTGYRGPELEDLGRLESDAAGGGRLLEAVRASARWIAHQQVLAELVRPGGERLSAELGLSPIQDAAGNVTHVVVTQTPFEPESPADRSTAQAGSDRRRFTRALLDQMRVGVVTADREARVSFLNRMAIETLGRPNTDCLGRELADLFGEEPLVSGALREVAGGGEARVEFFYQRPDQRPLELGLTVLRVAEHAPPEMTFVTLFRDLGDRRQIDMEMRRIERLTAVGNMVAGFAHEVRNPLAGMQALCEALHAETSPDDVHHEYATRMLTLLERVEAFVKASLQFGEPKPPRSARHRPEALLEAALASLTPRWGKRGTPPATHLRGPLPEIEVDDSQIAESLLALIENALDAAGDSARVELAIRCENEGNGQTVCFEVRDTGPGIPEGQLSRIFDPFYTTKPKGTGLGLPLAQTLVRENGGRLSVESAPGRGTTFRLHLPGVRS